MELPFKSELKVTDISTEAIIFVASLLLLFSMWKLHRAYGRERIWIFSLFGISLFWAGAGLDLLDEFFKLPQVIPRLIENGLISVGILVFSAGIVTVVKQLVMRANTDSLTGLYNKSYLDTVLGLEIERSKRYGLPLSILFLDLDNFKSVNDYLGHAIGDVVLSKIAENFRHTIRAPDVLFRYGGDEFVLLMPQTDMQGANRLLSRLRDAISRMEYQGGHRIDISAGIAMFPDDGDTVEKLLRVADRRMYESRGIESPVLSGGSGPNFADR